MKERILDAIAKSQQDGHTVLEIHLWSKEAVDAVHGSPEFAGQKFIGIPVKYVGRDHKVAEQDFILITSD